MDIWNILGIAPTRDERAIKKAYANMTKKYHPEEHPEEFKQLYEAYQKALKQVKWFSYQDSAGYQIESSDESWLEAEADQEEADGIIDFGPISENEKDQAADRQEQIQISNGETVQHQQDPIDGEEPQEAEIAFESAVQNGQSYEKTEKQEEYQFDELISKGLQQKRGEMEILFQHVIQRMEGLANGEQRNDRKQWQEEFQSPLFEQVQFYPDFIAEVCAFLLRHKGLSAEVWVEFYYAYNLYRLEGYRGENPCNRLFEILYPRYRNYISQLKENKKEEKWKTLLLYCVGGSATILLLILYCTHMLWVLVPFALLGMFAFLFFKWNLAERIERMNRWLRLLLSAACLAVSCFIWSVSSQWESINYFGLEMLLFVVVFVPLEVLSVIFFIRSLFLLMEGK